MVEPNAKGARVPPGFLQLLQQLSSAHLQPLSYVRKRKKNCQELGRSNISPYSQDNKLACHGFKESGRRNETPGSETKDSITPGIAGSSSLMVTAVSSAPTWPHPQHHGGNQGQPTLILYTQWHCITAEEPPN